MDWQADLLTHDTMISFRPLHLDLQHHKKSSHDHHLLIFPQESALMTRQLVEIMSAQLSPPKRLPNLLCSGRVHYRHSALEGSKNLSYPIRFPLLVLWARPFFLRQDMAF